MRSTSGFQSYAWGTVLLLMLTVSYGCRGDVQARKAAHFQKGNAYLAAGKYDGPQWGPGSGNIELAERNLSIEMGAPPRAMFNGLPVYDFTNNFFLARTETLRDVPWDNRFKIYGEHTDFFLRYSAKYRVTFVDEVAIGHDSSGYSLRGGVLRHGPSRR